jgi:hypothetical protein
MGAKSSHFLQSDRPESGGSNKDDIKDETGLHEKEKQKFASNKAKLEQDNHIPKSGENPEQTRVRGARAQGNSGNAGTTGA